jgi:iron(II)-dependent oxidoreductase
MMTEVRVLPQTRATPGLLAAALRDTYARTLRCVGDLAADRLLGPYLPIVNPPLWETGHVAWFLERWVLRRDGADPMIGGADALYDSARVAHPARWSLPLPDMQATISYLSRVTNAVLQRLEAGDVAAPEALYFVELSIHHQDMHNEAFRYTRQTHGLSNPIAGRTEPDGTRLAEDAGDAQLPAGALMLGSASSDGWIFDNEKWAHAVTVPAFSIARQAVSNARFLDFVEDGGYARREFWCEAGWHMLQETGRRAPLYWRRGDTGWQQRVYGEWVGLVPSWPVLHVSAFEAEAWCRWAGRRLPTEAEWERAAATTPAGAKRRYPWGEDAASAPRANLGASYLLPVDACPRGDSGWGLRQAAGNVWEWTASVFEPYPGFVADPYQEYSAPWFGTHRVLRGGCFATEARIARCAYRNFYTPDRADVFAGFRTCAL